MKLTTPFRFFGDLVSDGFRHPERLMIMLKQWRLARSLSLGEGKLPVRSLFEPVPGAEASEIRFQNLFEIPLFPAPHQDARQNSWTTLADMQGLILLLKSTPARVIVEYGTGHGHATLQFALNFPDNAVIYTTDYPERASSDYICHRSAEAGKIRQSFSLTKDWDLSAIAGTVDFQFIDATHQYEEVLADSKKALSLAAPGGLICWHDYSPSWKGVVRALDELASTGLDLVKIQGINIVAYRHPRAA